MATLPSKRRDAGEEAPAAVLTFDSNRLPPKPAHTPSLGKPKNVQVPDEAEAVVDNPEKQNFVSQSETVDITDEYKKRRTAESLESVGIDPAVAMPNRFGPLSPVRQNDPAAPDIEDPAVLEEAKSKALSPIGSGNQAISQGPNIFDRLIEDTRDEARRAGETGLEFASDSAQLADQVVRGGASDALVNTMKLVVEQGQVLRDFKVNGVTVQEHLDNVGLGGKVAVQIDRLERRGGAGTQLLRGLAAFGVGFAVTRQIAGPLVAGASADVLAIDRDANLSSLFNEMAPSLQNPITDFLSTKADDTELMKGVKNALEGGGIVASVQLVAGIVKMAKQLKAGGFRVLKNEDGSIQIGRNFQAKIKLTPAEDKVFAEILSKNNDFLTREDYITKRGFDLGARPSEVLDIEKVEFGQEWDALFENLPGDMKELLDEVPSIKYTQGQITIDPADLDALGNYVDDFVSGSGRFDSPSQNIKFDQGVPIPPPGFRNNKFMRKAIAAVDSTDPFRALKNEEGAIDLGPGRGNPELPDGVEKFVEIKGVVRDVGRLRINWNRIDLPEDVKTVQAGVRQLEKERIDEAVGPVRKLEDVEDEARTQLRANPQQELRDFLDKDISTGFTDVEFTKGRFLRDQSAIRLREIMNLIDEGFETTSTLARHYALHSLITAKTAAMSAQASQVLGAGRIISTEIGGLGHRIFAGKIDDLIEDIGTDVDPERLLDMLKAFESPAQLEAMARMNGRPGFGEMLLEAWMNGLLTGWKTHAVNNMSNGLRQIYHFGIEQPVAIGISKFTRSQDALTFTDLATSYIALNGAVQDGMTLFGRNMFQGLSGKSGELSGGVKVEAFRHTKITSTNIKALVNRTSKVKVFDLEQSGMIGKGFDGLWNVYRQMGFGALAASDEMWKTIAYRMSLRGWARSKAVKEGWTGRELSERIVDLMAEPPASLRIKSQKAADYLTFTNELGEKGQEFQKLLTKIPILRLGATFVKTPTNIFKQAGERTAFLVPTDALPVPIPVPLGLFFKETRDDIAAGGFRRDQALAKMGVGVVSSWFLSHKVAEGKITGAVELASLPSGTQEIYKMAGYRENSIIFEDDNGTLHYYRYDRLEPFGMAMGIMVDYAHIMRSSQDPEMWKNATNAVVAALSQQMFSKTWATGMSKLLNAMANPERYGAKFTENLVKTVVPRLAAQINRNAVDPVMRETATYLELLKSQTPGHSKELPGTRNIFGEVQLWDGVWGEESVEDYLGPGAKAVFKTFWPVRDTQITKDPIKLEMYRNKMDVPAVQETTGFGRAFGGAVIKLSPTQLERLKIIIAEEILPDGRNLKQTFGDIMQTDEYKAATPGPGGGREMFIQMAYRTFVNAGKINFLAENPEVTAKLSELAQEIFQRQSNEAIEFPDVQPDLEEAAQ